MGVLWEEKKKLFFRCSCFDFDGRNVFTTYFDLPQVSVAFWMVFEHLIVNAMVRLQCKQSPFYLNWVNLVFLCSSLDYRLNLGWVYLLDAVD